MSIAAQTLAKAFERQAMRFDKRPFLTRKEDTQWRDHTWSDLNDRAKRLRTGLIHLGINTGDRIAILSDNSPEWVIVDQAVLGMGGVVVPLYTTSGAEEMHHVLRDSGARLVAVNGDRLIETVRGLGEMPELEGILAMHSGATASDDSNYEVITIEQLSGFEPTRAMEGNKDDLATFIYTSGTTGQSKGVMLSHWNILSNCESNMAALQMTEQDLLLSFLPVAHSFERTAGYYTMMLAGGTIAYAEGLGQIGQNLLEIEPTLVLAVPRLLEMIYERINRTIEKSSRAKQFLFQSALKTGMQAAEYRLSNRKVPTQIELRMKLYRRQVFAKIKAIFGSRMRYMISGGAPLPQHINEFFTAAEVPLVEGYGLTEAAPVVSCNLHGKTRIGSVGRPLPGIEVSRAPDGELLVRGDNVMKGYYNSPEDTAEVIDADGWLHTGDIGEIDAEGFIRITDRKKDIIVLSGGKNISPAKIEAKLMADPFIAQACVIGDRRKHLAAIIVPAFESLKERQLKELGLDGFDPEGLVRLKELRNFFQDRIRELNRTLSDVEAVTDFILIAAPFAQDNGEMTPTMKVRRKVIQEHYREAIDALYGGARRAIPMPPPPLAPDPQPTNTAAQPVAAAPTDDAPVSEPGAASAQIDEPLHHNGSYGTNGSGSYPHAEYAEVIVPPPPPPSLDNSREVVLEAGQILASADTEVEAPVETQSALGAVVSAAVGEADATPVEPESAAVEIGPVPLVVLANGLQQVAFVVKNLENAQSFFGERMGVPRFFVMEDFADRATEKTFRGRPTKHKFKIAIAYSGNTQIELIEHVAGNTTYKEFLDRRGEGMHHLGYFIEDREQHDRLYREFAARHAIVQSGRFGETIYTYFDTEAAIGAIIELVYLDPEAKAMMDRVRRGEF